MNKKLSNTFPLYIYNPIEDEWGFISSFPKKEQKKLIHNSNRFADSYLFSNVFFRSFTFVSPINISDDFINYFEKLSGSHCNVLTPLMKTPFICDNIALDAEAFSTIASAAKRTGALSIFTYAMTFNVFNLKKAFEKAGVQVLLPESPEEKNLWTVGYFGSKSGFRKSFTPLMPPGSLELDYKKIPKKAMYLFQSTSGIVLKTDKGNAGQGVHIMKKNEIKTQKNLLGEIKKIFNKEPYLKKHPLILETYIDTSKEKKCPYPSVECFINQDGKIDVPYYCNMIVTSKGEFYGMEMHRDVFTKKVKKEVFRIAMKIAKTYREAGFRGRFDIDMINDGKNIYANESNTRTTGGTDTYFIVKKIIGNNFFSQRYVLSSYVDLPKTITPLFQTIKKIITPLSYNNLSKTGVIINSESVIINKGFSYVIIGKNKKETVLLHNKLKNMLTAYRNKVI